MLTFTASESDDVFVVGIVRIIFAHHIVRISLLLTAFCP